MIRWWGIQKPSSVPQTSPRSRRELSVTESCRSAKSDYSLVNTVSSLIVVTQQCHSELGTDRSRWCRVRLPIRTTPPWNMRYNIYFVPLHFCIFYYCDISCSCVWQLASTCILHKWNECYYWHWSTIVICFVYRLYISECVWHLLLIKKWNLKKCALGESIMPGFRSHG